MATNDEYLYLQAMQEVDDGSYHAGLWAKALTLEKGNIDQARYCYVQLRVEQLKNIDSPDKPSVLPVNPVFSPNPKRADSSEPQQGTDCSFLNSPGVLNKLVLSALWLLVIVTLMAIFFDAKQINLLKNIETISAETAEANDARIALIGKLQIVISIISSLIVFVWQYKTNKNCHRFGAQGMRFTPGWAVGWNFVPGMNLYRPYQVMQEIWKVSTDPAVWKKQPSSSLVKWWWCCSLVCCFIQSYLFKISLRNTLNVQSIQQLQEMTYASIVTGCTLLLSSVMTICLIRAIRDKQYQLTGRMAQNV